MRLVLDVVEFGIVVVQFTHYSRYDERSAFEQTGGNILGVGTIWVYRGKVLTGEG